jgi:hypothetical protein
MTAHDGPNKFVSLLKGLESLSARLSISESER